jgi:large subunit ribosomal protein L25
MADIVLNVEVRDNTGTGGARAARRAGLVPGVLYGGKEGPVAVSVKQNEFRKALFSGKLLGHMVTLRHKGKDQNVIAKDVQFHPVNDQPIHFDLYRVDKDQEIRIAVAVHFLNHDEAPGLKRGGALNVVRHEVEVLCHADQIPDQLEYDLTGLDIGDTVRMSAIKLPEGVKPAMGERDFVIATIAGRMAQAAEDEAADEAEAEEQAEVSAEAAEETGEAEGGEDKDKEG